MITNDDDNSNPLIRFGPSPQKNYGHTSSKNNHGTYKIKQVIKETRPKLDLKIIW